MRKQYVYSHHACFKSLKAAAGDTFFARFQAVRGKEVPRTTPPRGGISLRRRLCDRSEFWGVSNGCFYKLGPFSVGVLKTRALLVGFFISWKLRDQQKPYDTNAKRVRCKGTTSLRSRSHVRVHGGIRSFCTLSVESPR